MNKGVITTLILLLIVLVFAGCTGEPPVEGPTVEPADSPPVEEEPSNAPDLTLEDYPRIDGSTVTIPLNERLTAEVLDMPLEEARTHVLHAKTHGAYVNLINGDRDLIFVTAPSEEERQLAAENGVTLEIVSITAEGFIFLTRADLDVDSLTPDQIRKIYTGQIANWSEVGGQDLPILAFQRPENSGSQTGFLDLVMQGESPQEPPLEQVMAEMGMLIDAVASFRPESGAIGYSYYYFATDMWRRDEVKLLSIDGIAPTPENFSSGAYPFTTHYYAVFRADEDPGSPVRQIVDWLLSEEGQQLVEEAGYVRLAP